MNQASFSTPAALGALIAQARAGKIVIAGLYSSDNCPWCVALKKEQLVPRLLSASGPKLQVVEFNADSSLRFALPDGSKKTARQWAHDLDFRLMPTVAMLNEKAAPIGEPLIGYASPDFYATYLEERIKAAQTYWQTLRI